MFHCPPFSQAEIAALTLTTPGFSRLKEGELCELCVRKECNRVIAKFHWDDFSQQVMAALQLIWFCAILRVWMPQNPSKANGQLNLSTLKTKFWLISLGCTMKLIILWSSAIPELHSVASAQAVSTEFRLTSSWHYLRLLVGDRKEGRRNISIYINLSWLRDFWGPFISCVSFQFLHCHIEAVERAQQTRKWNQRTEH